MRTALARERTRAQPTPTSCSRASWCCQCVIHPCRRTLEDERVRVFARGVLMPSKIPSAGIARGALASASSCSGPLQTHACFHQQTYAKLFLSVRKAVMDKYACKHDPVFRVRTIHHRLGLGGEDGLVRLVGVAGLEGEGLHRRAAITLTLALALALSYSLSLSPSLPRSLSTRSDRLAELSHNPRGNTAAGSVPASALSSQSVGGGRRQRPCWGGLWDPRRDAERPTPPPPRVRNPRGELLIPMKRGTRRTD